MTSVDDDEGPEEYDNDDLRSTSQGDATIDINDTMFEEVADDSTHENAMQYEVGDGFNLLTQANDLFTDDGGTASFDDALETDSSSREEDRHSDSSSSEEDDSVKDKNSNHNGVTPIQVRRARNISRNDAESNAANLKSGEDDEHIKSSTSSTTEDKDAYSTSVRSRSPVGEPESQPRAENECEIIESDIKGVMEGDAAVDPSPIQKRKLNFGNKCVKKRRSTTVSARDPVKTESANDADVETGKDTQDAETGKVTTRVTCSKSPFHTDASALKSFHQ